MGNLNPIMLRSSIGDCLLDELLFEGTLLENITMGRDKATFENVKWATENVGLKDYVKSLPDGYNTYIHPKGTQFSKGVIDKIILARSIADKPKLLLVKDVFSSMREEEKSEIIDFLISKEHNWTLVMSSTDKFFESKMDKIIKTENGFLTQIN
jgi:ABC-type multidrug transport system fused ATPase/permease subunit